MFFQFDKENERDLWKSFIVGIAVVSGGRHWGNDFSILCNYR